MDNPYEVPEPPRCKACDEFMTEVRIRFAKNEWECRNPECAECADKYKAVAEDGDGA
jgi:hypothetical protein